MRMAVRLQSCLGHQEWKFPCCSRHTGFLLRVGVGHIQPPVWEGDPETKFLIVAFVLTFAVGLQDASIVVAQWDVVLLHERPDVQDERQIVPDDILIAHPLGPTTRLCLHSCPARILGTYKRMISQPEYIEFSVGVLEHLEGETNHQKRSKMHQRFKLIHSRCVLMDRK